MIIEAILPIRAFTINQYYTGNGRHKTSAARNWETKFLYEIAVLQPQLDAMNNLWAFKGGVFSLQMTFMYANFYTLKGGINPKTYDLTNSEKAVQDLLFRQLNIDDRNVVDLRSFKRPGSYDSIKIVLELMPLSVIASKTIAHSDADVPSSRPKRAKRKVANK